MKENEVEMKEEKVKKTVGRRSTRNIEQTDVKRKKAKKKKMNMTDRMLVVLLILVAVELLMIPCFIYAGMNQIFPIIMFVVLPTVCAFIILLLSRNTLMESKKKTRQKAEQNS